VSNSSTVFVYGLGMFGNDIGTAVMPTDFVDTYAQQGAWSAVLRSNLRGGIRSGEYYARKMACYV